MCVGRLGFPVLGLWVWLETIDHVSDCLFVQGTAWDGSSNLTLRSLRSCFCSAKLEAEEEVDVAMLSTPRDFSFSYDISTLSTIRSKFASSLYRFVIRLKLACLERGRRTFWMSRRRSKRRCALSLLLVVGVLTVILPSVICILPSLYFRPSKWKHWSSSFASCWFGRPSKCSAEDGDGKHLQGRVVQEEEIPVMMDYYYYFFIIIIFFFFWFFFFSPPPIIPIVCPSCYCCFCFFWLSSDDEYACRVVIIVVTTTTVISSFFLLVS